MLYVRALFLTSVLAACGCAAPKKHIDVQMGDRISRICALPEGERAAEIEKLKRESQMVLYCGK